MVIGGGPCKFHGGAAPQVAAAREARIIAGTAALGQHFEPRHPVEALLAAAADSDVILQRIKSTLAAGETPSAAMLTALGDWIDRTARISKLVLDAGIDERQVRLAESHGAQLVVVIRGVLRRLALSPEQEALVPVVVPEELRRVSDQSRRELLREVDGQLAIESGGA